MYIVIRSSKNVLVAEWEHFVSEADRFIVCAGSILSDDTIAQGALLINEKSRLIMAIRGDPPYQSTLRNDGVEFKLVIVGDFAVSKTTFSGLFP